MGDSKQKNRPTPKAVQDAMGKMRSPERQAVIVVGGNKWKWLKEWAK